MPVFAFCEGHEDKKVYFERLPIVCARVANKSAVVTTAGNHQGRPLERDIPIVGIVP